MTTLYSVTLSDTRSAIRSFHVQPYRLRAVLAREFKTMYRVWNGAVVLDLESHRGMIDALIVFHGSISRNGSWNLQFLLNAQKSILCGLSSIRRFTISNQLFRIWLNHFQRNFVNIFINNTYLPTNNITENNIFHWHVVLDGWKCRIGVRLESIDRCIFL